MNMAYKLPVGDEQVPQMSGMSAIDYTTPAAFTVFAEDCSTVEYFVTVVVDENTGNDIEELTVDGEQSADCDCDDPVEIVAEVEMEETDITVTVPYGTDLSGVV